MFFSSVLFRTIFLFQVSFLLVILPGVFSTVLQAKELTDSAITRSDNSKSTEADQLERNQPKIDWSKPAVSRGFGLEKSEGETNAAALKQYQSGQVFYFFGDYKKAAEKWIPLLENSFPEAQASMGWLYQAGLGVGKDETKAFELYSKAANQNNAIAQNNLGVMYENGISTKKNLKLAMQWYQQSAENGYRFGQYNYARLLLKENRSQDAFSKAKEFLKLAADQGVDQAGEKLDALSN